MRDYIINYDVAGYKKVKITDINNLILENKVDNLVIYLDKDTESDMQNYYREIRQAIINSKFYKVKIVCINTGDLTSTSKTIFSMMASFDNFNIYNTDEKSNVTKFYVDTAVTRETCYEEVSNLVSGEITSYSDVNIIITGITELVKSGDVQGLKKFVESKFDSIIKFKEVVEYLKHVDSVYNSGELEKTIRELKDSSKCLSDSLKELSSKLEIKSKDCERLHENTEKLETKVKDLTERYSAYENNNDNKSSMIREYTSFNTAISGCRIPYVIYIKEISYVQYTNTFITAFMEMVKNKLPDIKPSERDHAVKLLIYDDKVGVSPVYTSKEIQVIDGKNYISNKDSLIRAIDKFVVAEPLPNIINDIVNNLNSNYKVIIIYDRMKNTTDIITGNNVSKFFVINSLNDYLSTKDVFNINSTSKIITRHDSRINNYKKACTIMNILPIESMIGAGEELRLPSLASNYFRTNKKLMTGLAENSNIPLKG